MKAIEFSTEIEPSKHLIIPPRLQSQLTVGSQVRVVILFDTDLESTAVSEDDELAQLLDEIVRTPTSPNLFIPATETVTIEEAAAFLADDPVDFDTDAWNTQWDTHELAEKERSRANVEAQLNDFRTVLE